MASLLGPVERRVSVDPTSIAIRDERGDYTYQTLLAVARRFAAGLRDRQVGVGDRIVLVAPTVAEFVVAYLGIQVAGAVVVPMNTMSTKDEVDYVLQDSGACAVIIWPEVGEAPIRAARAAGVPIIALTAQTWQDADPLEIESRAMGDTAAILYTSGTTGRAKGAELTMANILRSAELSVEVSAGSPADRVGTALPLFHIFGQISVMMSALTSGASLTLISPFKPERMMELVKRDQLTVIAGVPTMWNAMLQLAPDSDERLNQVRLAVSGGASLPGHIASEFERRFGCELFEGYGLTETTSLATFARSGDTRAPGSVGRPVPRTRVEIRNESSAPVQPNEVGEINILGPTVMKGYWKRPEETRAVLSEDGWLRTGDLGRIDQSGQLFIVDRLKDLIIRGGYNVYPSEIEEVLYRHPQVIEAAVLGVPDDHYGEEVAAVVVLQPGAALTADELSAWTREHLSAYKIPRIVKFTDQLPKGPSGKILKRLIDVNSIR